MNNIIIFAPFKIENMKKIALIITALLIGFMAFAQAGLDGTWYYEESQSEQKDAEGGGSGDLKMVMSVTYTFSGSTYKLGMQARADMDLSGTDKNGKEVNAVFMINIDGSHYGALSRQGDIIKLVPSTKEKPKVEVTTDVQGVPGGGLLKTMLVSPLKKEINSGLKETESYKVISVTETELVLGEILTDKEISKGKAPEQITFKRK